MSAADFGTKLPDEPLASRLQFRSIFVFAAGCVAIILFALVPATTRIAAVQLSGLSIGLTRAVGAGIFAFPLLLALRMPSPRTLNQWALCGLYALGNFAGFPILFGIGVRHTSGSHAALLMATMPLIIGFVGMLLERRVPRGIWFVGAAIAAGGQAALVGMGSIGNAGSASFTGDAIVFAACTLSALGIAAGARLGSQINPFAATLWAITISSATLAPWAVIRLLAVPYAYQELTGATWAAILQITLGAAVIANMAWLWAVSRGGLVRVVPIQFTQPVCALFFACALLNEHLTVSLFLIAVSIVLGTITACRGARPAAAANKEVDLKRFRLPSQRSVPLMPEFRPLPVLRYEPPALSIRPVSTSNSPLELVLT